MHLRSSCEEGSKPLRRGHKEYLVNGPCRSARQQDEQPLDAVGVGIGPFNLSVAALLQPLGELRSRFFERSAEFQWHAGLLFPEATLQVSFLKDLVTLADPTSPYSFLSFLFATKRLYRFINASFPRVMRREFNQYLRWVCASLPNLEFGRTVDAVSYEQNALAVDVGAERIRARNLILGSGLSPYVPECAQPYLGPTVFHASRYLKLDVKPAGRRVAVIGGGQTSAEIVAHLLSDTASLPSQLLWISRRPNFLPLDDSPFTNELFTPAYSDYFFSLPPAEKARLIAEQKLASDGISSGLLEQIYRRLYELEYLEERGPLCRLLPNRELVTMSEGAHGRTLTVEDLSSGRAQVLDVDIVVLCTGYEYRLPSYLEPLAGRISWTRDGFVVRDDFSIEWDGPASLKIYVQNAAKRSRGIADPNLSLMAWRSAMIVNSLLGSDVYQVKEEDALIEWSGLEATENTGGYIDDYRLQLRRTPPAGLHGAEILAPRHADR